ncbi:hypothetical protein LTS18_013921, partial [Coniosporium uncinatum]
MGGEQDKEDWITKVVRVLDMALILPGAPGREDLIAGIMSTLSEYTLSLPSNKNHGQGQNELKSCTTKRRKLNSDVKPVRPSDQIIPPTFPIAPICAPHLTHPIPRVSDLPLHEFQAHLSSSSTATACDTPAPLIIAGALEDWPAISDSTRRWDNPQYLMAQTIGGRRLVPIEIGRSYTDEGWGQQIVTFGHFMREYLLPPSTSSPSCSESSNNHETVALNGAETERPVDTVTNEHYDSAKIAYLAQHDLLTQLPSLRADILIPDYCFSSPPPPIPTHAPLPSAEELDTPLQNAWLGPPGTVSPLHTDPYHNILCQVVGY